jgi:hypothetical protein
VTVYLAGPMTGIDDFNYPTFNTAAALLRKACDHVVINPAEFFSGDTTLPRDAYLRYGLSELAMNAEAVVLLAGWQDSAGVRAELDVAVALDIPVYEFPAYYHWKTQGTPQPEPLVLTEKRMMSGHVPPRADVLQEAAGLITGDRNNAYGPPTQDFKRSADAMTAMGYRANLDQPIRPHDVAILVALVKVSRLQHSPQKRDNWTDLAGYAGCGYECAITEDVATTEETK